MKISQKFVRFHKKQSLVFKVDSVIFSHSSDHILLIIEKTSSTEVFEKPKMIPIMQAKLGTGVFFGCKKFRIYQSAELKVRL